MNSLFGGVKHDVRQTLRGLRSRPGACCTIVLVAGLSIAVNTTVFSVVSAVLLRRPAYPHPEQLVRVWFGKPADREGRATPSDLERWSHSTAAFEHLAAYRSGVRTVAVPGGAGHGLPVVEVSSSFFAVLRAFPSTGRVFRDEDEAVDALPVAVVSSDFWGASSDGLGVASIVLDGMPHRVVGVMPASFAFPDRDTRVWVPLRKARAPVVVPGVVITSMETASGIGRLKPGVSLAEAVADGRALFVGTDPHYSPQVGWLTEVDTRAIRGVLFLLQVAVLLILLIACANVSHLLLARAVERKPEFAVRMALGASPYRMLRQWATEGLILAASGGALGLLLTAWGIRWLRNEAPPAIGSHGEIRLDPAVVIFCAGATVAVAVLTVALPAWRTLRWNPEDMDLCRKVAGSTVTGRTGVRRLLIGVQFAMALALIVTALAVTRSFAKLVGIDSGYDLDGVATTQLRIPDARYAGHFARAQLLGDVLSMASEIPGLRRVALANHFPLDEQQFFTFSIQGDARQSFGRRQLVSDAYFQTPGIRILRGRGFAPSDSTGAPPAVVVSRAFAATYFSGTEPIGRTIFADGRRWTVIGVTGDVRGGKLTEPSWAGAYFNLRQLGEGQAGREQKLPRVILFARADHDAVTGLRMLERRLQALDPALAFDGISPLAQRLDSAIAVPRFIAAIMLAFSAVSILLAGMGVSGMVGHTVAERVPEFGVRLALGATRRDIYLEIGYLVALPLVAGTGLGLLGGFWLVSSFRALLYGVSPFDASPMLTCVGILVGCALLACLPAARRAAAVEPAVVLRDS